MRSTAKIAAEIKTAFSTAYAASVKKPTQRQREMTAATAATMAAMAETGKEINVFQTRSQLKKRIRYLEWEVKLSDESGLKKARGVFCIGCAHAVWYQHGDFSKKVIGCDVDIPCKDFSRTAGTYATRSE